MERFIELHPLLVGLGVLYFMGALGMALADSTRVGESHHNPLLALVWPYLFYVADRNRRRRRAEIEEAYRRMLEMLGGDVEMPAKKDEPENQHRSEE